MKPKNPKFVPLCEAVIKNDMDSFVKILNEGCDVNEKDYNDVTALWYASSNGRYEMAKMLVEQNANLEARDKFGCAPLSKAVFFFNLVPDGKLIKLLVDAGADPFAQNYYGVSPVSLAHNIMGFPQEYIDILEEKTGREQSSSITL